MVKINQIQFTTTITAGRTSRTPVTYVHLLTCKKEAPTFKVGETDKCFVAKYDGGRFAVFTMSGIKSSKYHVFESEKELHDHFDEVTA